jgi:hypothetical protein
VINVPPPKTLPVTGDGGTSGAALGLAHLLRTTAEGGNTPAGPALPISFGLALVALAAVFRRKLFAWWKA